MKRQESALASLLIAAVLAAFLASSGCTEHDVARGGSTGWRDTRWGMSSEELQAQLGSLVRPLPSRKDFGRIYYTDLVADHYMVCGESFTVFLQMGRRDHGLARVLIEHADSTSTYSEIALCAQLEALLTETHGEPDVTLTEDGDGVVNLQRKWFRDTYVIDMDYLFVDLIESSNLFIAYAPRSEDDIGRL